MRTLYEAANGVEAHMILNLLEQQGIVGRVDGEFLQGGIGELPAAGLVRVMVSEEDYSVAKPIVDMWNISEPAPVDSPPQKKSGSRLTFLLAGLLVGWLCTYAYYRAPISRDGIDNNRDGVIDDKWTFGSSGLAILNEVDRNLDGKVDLVTTFENNGSVESIKTDDNFDGVFESTTIYRQGNPYRTETDTDGDGFYDLKTNFKAGVVDTVEYIYPTSGMPQKIEHYKFGKRVYAETDTDLDGKLDQRTNFDELGNVRG